MTVRNQSINLSGFSGTPYADGSDTETIALLSSSGNGSTNTNVIVFDTLPASTDTYVVASTAAAGSSVKIARPGVYFAQLLYRVEEVTGTILSSIAITVDDPDLDITDTDTHRGVGGVATEDAGSDAIGYTSAMLVVDAADAANAAAAVVRGLTTATAATDVSGTPGTVSLRLTRIASFDG